MLNSLSARVRPHLRGLGGVGVLSVVHVLATLCGLLGTVIWTRWMPQETFGQFRVVTSVLTTASAFCLLGTGQAAMMSAARDIDGNLTLLAASKFKANLVGALIVLGGAAYYAWGQEASVAVSSALVVAALLFPLYNTSDLWMAWLNGKAQINSLAAGRMLTSLLSLVSVAVLGIAGVTDEWIMVLCFMGLLAVQNLVLLRRVMAARSNTDTDRSLIQFGQHTTVAMMFSSLLALDVVILNHYHSPQEVAVYVVALIFPEQIKAFFAMFNQVLSPRLYRQQSLAELWAGFRGQFFLLTAGFVGLGIVGYFLLPIVTAALFSERYQQAAEYGKELWLVIACLGSTTYLGNALQGTQKPFFTYAAYIGYPFTLGALYFAWAERGVPGMIAARIVATVALSAFYVAAFFIYMRMQKGEHA